MTDKKTKLALEALEEIHPGNMTPIAEEAWNKAITAIREALAEQPAQQDSTCNKKLREQGKAYPRTCKKCGLGPCIADRVQPAPVAKPQQQQYQSTAEKCELTPVPAKGGLLPAQQQEPVAVIRSVVHSGDGGVRVTWLGGFPQIGDLLYTAPPASKPHEQHEPVACKTLCELCVKRGYHFCANAAQTTPIPSPPASKPWVGLTDEEIEAMWPLRPTDEIVAFARAIEAKLKEKNT